KATVEIPSPRAGRVVKLGASEGERVPVGHVLIVIEEQTAPPDSAPSEAAEAEVTAAGSAASGESEAPPAPGSPSVRPIAKAAAALLRAVEATPAVRALARELGVDLAQVRGTGPGGRIVPDDVRREARGGAVETPATPPAAIMETEVPATGSGVEPGRPA